MTRVDVEALINDQPLGWQRWMILLLISATIIVDGFDIQMIAFVTPVLIESWGVSKAELALAVSAALAGMAIGAPIGGWIGDRFGRRPAIIASVAFFGLATLPVALAENVAQLAFLRFISGLGFGAVLPNATAMIAEWMPARMRSYMISLMIVGVPIGGMIGAGISNSIIVRFGWQGCFWVAGFMALALAVCLFALPESPKYLVRKSTAGRDVIPLLKRAFGGLRFEDGDTYHISESTTSSWAEIFSKNLRFTTLGITLAFFCSLLVFYGFANWLPTILTAKGMPLAEALRAAMFFNLSGFVGALLVAAAVAQFGARVALLGALCGGIAVCVAVSAILSVDYFQVSAAMIAVAIAGACLAGLQVGLYSLAASVFSTGCRATGIGFAAGVGRLGPIISAAAGGLILDQPNGNALFFGIAAIILALAISGITVAIRRPHGEAN